MKMGIIGYGSMARWHNKTIGKIESLEIGGVWDIKEEARVRAKEDGLFVYDSLEELLSDDKLSFVLISTDNDVHAPLAIKAMESGKHVVCEKPITLSSQLLDDMILVSKRTGMLLSVHQNRRWDKDYCTVKRIFEGKDLGRIFRIESRVHGSRGISDTWRRIKEKGGGVIYDWGVHLFDQLLQLRKGIGIKSVYSIAHNITTEFVEDGFTAIITFEDGLQALVEVETSDFVGCPRWILFGERGTAQIDNWDSDGKIVKYVEDEAEVTPFITSSGFTKTMAPRRDDTIIEKQIIPVSTDVTEFYKNIMAAIRKEENSIITFGEMRNVIRLIEATFESIEKQQAVGCNLIF